MRRTRICKFEEPNSKKSVGKPTIHYERVLCCPRFEPEVSLYQWRGGSRMVCGPLEGVMQLLTDPLTRGSSIEVKVRGPRDTNRACFFFLEELLGIVDQVGHIFHTLSFIYFPLHCSFKLLHHWQREAVCILLWASPNQFLEVSV